MKAKKVYEFKRGRSINDTSKHLGLGYEGRTIDWIDKYLNDVNYEIKPEGITTIYGTFDIKHGMDDQIISVPTGLVVQDTMYIVNCKNLVKLPDNLYVGGYLDIRGCTSLIELPPGLTVGIEI